MAKSNENIYVIIILHNNVYVCNISSIMSNNGNNNNVCTCNI